MTVEVILYLASGMGIALVVLATWAWNHTHKRIDNATARIEAEVRCARIKFDKKADEVEMVRQRDRIVELFEGQEKIRSEMNNGFTQLADKMNRSHLVLLDKLGEITRK